MPELGFVQEVIATKTAVKKFLPDSRRKVIRTRLLSQLNILNGAGDNNFAPKDFATRAEAAVVIYKLYNSFKK